MSAYDEFRREHELWKRVERQRYEEQTHGGSNHRANPGCAKCRAIFEPAAVKAKRELAKAWDEGFRAGHPPYDNPYLNEGETL